MGKNNGKGKREREPARTPYDPSVKKNEGPAAPIAYVSDEDLAVAMDVIQQLRLNPDLFRSPRLKKLRAEIFPLVQTPVGGHVSRVSDALSDGRWEDAKLALEGLRKTGEIPKLGTVQRWVRDCDLAGVEDKEALVCLDLLLRVACPEQIARAPTPADVIAATNEEVSNIYRLPQWCGVPLREGSTPASSQRLVRNKVNPGIVGNFSTISVDLAHNRKPPNLHDLPIWVATPNTIPMAVLDQRPPVERIEVPSVKGTFFLKNVLSVDECNAILEAAESVGFTPDVPITDKTKSVLAHNFCWLADASFMHRLWERVEPYLLPKIHDCKLAGINKRFRCYRYEPGAVYRPHVDGAWPPSGIDADGEYQFDVSEGTLWSKMTFLMYLNEGFEGGCTTFYTPAHEEGKLLASAVGPRVGGVLVFPHGDTSGALVHEGSGVVSGCKYIIRTEVIYTKGAKHAV